MHTREVVAPGKLVACADGKSSLGRLGIVVHQTAGFIDPGFSGNITLEVTVTNPIRVYAGMRFAQVRFHTVVGESSGYKGNYTGEHARGPVASRAWKQFKS
jgi:dCTP deaminase